MRDGGQLDALSAGRELHQLHLHLAEGGLEELVDELTQAALGAIEPWLVGEDEENHLVLRAALRQGLKRYVTAFDICGAAAFCGDATRFDPWR